MPLGSSWIERRGEDPEPTPKDLVLATVLFQPVDARRPLPWFTRVVAGILGVAFISLGFGLFLAGVIRFFAEGPSPAVELGWLAFLMVPFGIRFLRAARRGRDLSAEEFLGIDE
jgi:hypothetical protein